VTSLAEQQAADRGATTADVRLTRVTKRFDDVVAVDDLSLEIERGRFFAMLGPSGCGKTTTLRMIGGFEQPTAGTIELGGREVTGLPPYRRDVNTVFQSYALFPHLSVFENIAFGLRRQGVPRDQIRDRVREMLALVGLGGFGDRKPRQLSGGQQQRVALARALVCKPQVLLLDEPLGALDLKLRKQMQLFLKQLQHDVGITFIHVTHDQEEAMTMADTIAVMDRGRIEQLGTPDELYERPSTAFVAGFLGASNLLHGTVAGEDLVRLDSGAPVRVMSSDLDGRSGRVAVGVRPEKVRLDPDGANAFSGQVVETAYVGVSTQYVVDTPPGRITVYVQNAQRGAAAATVGDPVTISFDPDVAFVVDPSSQEVEEE
jgi:spermidine/putrescine transport system ATP-binding protein